jgi:predicted transglutaminase-like cysteine proteinase
MLPRLTGCAAALFAVLCFATQTAGMPRPTTVVGDAAITQRGPVTELRRAGVRFAATDPLENRALETKPVLGADRKLFEPFGSAWVTASVPDLWSRWSEVEKQIQSDRQTLADCRIRRATCSPAAEQFLSIVDEGRSGTGIQRIGMINRSINLAIQPRGVQDRWSAPLETFTTGRGDCKSYAIAKYVALLELGIPKTDLRIVIVRIRASNQNHAIVAVRLDGEWITLDNRTLMLVPDVEISLVTPLFVIDEDSIREIGTAVNPATAVSTELITASRDSAPRG